ncbi:hypothetical protein DRP77_05635 [Candidatus Poribacteria bacterium]|nr:MAG: hypothetical protein DRP77_05635 [Candidatus Poribacteria bacterium]
MAWFGLVLTSLAGFYLMVVLMLWIGGFFADKRGGGESACPRVSVVIPARNEEGRIGRCLRAVLSQDYPAELMEVVVVDDRSTDGTAEEVERTARGDGRVKLVRVTYKPPWLTGKQNALDEGLKACAGEVILNTDADCLMGRRWVRSMVSRIEGKTGLVVGFTLIKRSGRLDLVSELLSLDMLFLLGAAFGAVGLGTPVSCIGNNIAYRRELIEEVGGFSKLGRTVTEDAQLIQEVRRRERWGVRAAIDPEAVVYTYPPRNAREFMSQRVRWLVGGLRTRGWTVLPLLPMLLLHFCIPIGFLLGIAWRPLLLVSAAVLSAKFAADLLLASTTALRLKKPGLIALMPLYELFLIGYSIAISIHGLRSTEIKWKGETYRR